MVATITCRVTATAEQFKSGEVKKALRSHALRTRSDFINEYNNGTKTGRFYGRHRASASGETPARITGKLGRGFVFNANNTTSTFGTNTEYGKFLEFGTRKMKPRNGVLQAINKNMQTLELDLLDLYKK